MSRTIPCVVFFVLQLLFINTACATLVGLTGASTTYDQGAPFTVGSAIDGVVVGSNGWGVGAGQTSPQTSVFQTSAPLTASELTFSMPQNLGGRHVIKQFRLSATTDSNPTVTSGATWTELAPTSYSAGRDMLLDVGGNMLRRSGISDKST